MNKFLELSFSNHIRNNDELANRIDRCYDPLLNILRDKLSVKACDEIEEILADCINNAMYLAGLAGMELAIGVMNGTICQRIE